jgi:hypothetical protein
MIMAFMEQSFSYRWAHHQRVRVGRRRKGKRSRRREEVDVEYE